jgi:hypothetical protein
LSHKRVVGFFQFIAHKSSVDSFIENDVNSTADEGKLVKYTDVSTKYLFKRLAVLATSFLIFVVIAMLSPFKGIQRVKGKNGNHHRGTCGNLIG